MSTRGKNPKSLQNLADTSAPDQPGDTKAITVRITTAQWEWLKSQPEAISYHARRAFDVYIDRVQSMDLSKSDD